MDIPEIEYECITCGNKKMKLVENHEDEATLICPICGAKKVLKKGQVRYELNT